MHCKLNGKQSPAITTAANLDYYGNPKKMCQIIMFQHPSSSKRCENDLKLTPTKWKRIKALFQMTSTKIH